MLHIATRKYFSIAFIVIVWSKCIIPHFTIRRTFNSDWSEIIDIPFKTQFWRIGLDDRKVKDDIIETMFCGLEEKSESSIKTYSTSYLCNSFLKVTVFSDKNFHKLCEKCKTYDLILACFLQDGNYFYILLKEEHKLILLL